MRAIMPAPISFMSAARRLALTTRLCLSPTAKILVRAAPLDRGLHAAFDKATQIDPANADAWSGLAFAASRTRRPDVTLHALAMRSKYLPEVPSTLLPLGDGSYDSLHQKKEAAAYYHRFLDVAAGKFPDQEWQARQRLKLLGK
jgi:hypothetical protein